ncbi:MAG: hypothetical protein LBG21_00295 [Campylobacteraceae bacterium]|nr:hypothetical protein [Campylobacteraceae bacterium]
MGVSKSLYSFILQRPHIGEIQRILKFTAVIIAIAIWIFITFSIVVAVLWLVFFGFVIFIGAKDIKNFKTKNKIKIDVIREKLAVKIANDPCKITCQIGIEPDVSLMSKRELKMVIALYFLHQNSGNDQLLMKAIRTRNIYSYIFDYFYEAFIDDGYVFDVGMRERNELTKKMLDADDICSIAKDIANNTISIINNIYNNYKQFVNFAKKIDPEYKVLDNILPYKNILYDERRLARIVENYIAKDSKGVDVLFELRDALVKEIRSSSCIIPIRIDKYYSAADIITEIDREIERVLSKDIYDNMWKPLLVDYIHMLSLYDSVASIAKNIANYENIWVGDAEKFIDNITKFICEEVFMFISPHDTRYEFLTKFLSPEASMQLDKLIIKSFSDAESIKVYTSCYYPECIAYNYPEIYRKIKHIDFKTDDGKKVKNYISQMADTYQNDYLRTIIYKYLLHEADDDYADIPIGKERDILKDILSARSVWEYQNFNVREYDKTINLMDKMLFPIEQK